jgi:DNA-directed RNA polymerase specialized sigma24 family protein
MTEPNETPELPVGQATIADRIAAFVMLDEMADATQAQKAMRLSLVGFTASEIAAMLQTTIPTIHQSLYAERKKLKPPRQTTTKESPKTSPGARSRKTTSKESD